MEAIILSVLAFLQMINESYAGIQNGEKAAGDEEEEHIPNLTATNNPSSTVETMSSLRKSGKDQVNVESIAVGTNRSPDRKTADLIRSMSSTTDCPDGMKYNDCCQGCGWIFTSIDELWPAASCYDPFNIGAFGDINCWNIEQASDLQPLDGLFSPTFNENINCWNVSQVTDMSYMFSGASSFNQPLDQWDTSKVTSMYFMFELASSFNQPLDQWVTSKVTNMNGMFHNTSTFNQPLNEWDTGNVTGMGVMFNGASSFNQPLDQWDTGKVTDMGSMFDGASSFNQPLNQWNNSLNQLADCYPVSYNPVSNNPVSSGFIFGQPFNVFTILLFTVMWSAKFWIL